MIFSITDQDYTGLDDSACSTPLDITGFSKDFRPSPFQCLGSSQGCDHACSHIDVLVSY